MPLNRFIPNNPWNTKSIIFGLVLGVCLFQLCCPPLILAIDSNSPLFEQGQSGKIDKNNTPQSLALPEATPNPSPGLFSTLVKVLAALGIIIGLIYVTIWGLKIMMGKRGWTGASDESKPVKILDTTYLAPRKTIHLVEVGKRILVIGAGQDEMNCLDVISDPVEVDNLKQAAKHGFPKIFANVLQKNDAAQQENETKKILEESSQLVGGYLEKLKKISRTNKQNPRKPEDPL